MKASIIICTRNRVRSLEATLDCVWRLEIPEDLSVELIVVDNGSDDGTHAVVARARPPEGIALRYVLERRPGIARARNRGLSEAAGDILLFIDDDIRLPANWLRVMCAAVLDGKDAVCSGVTMPARLERPWMTAHHRGMLACPGRLNPAAPPDQVGLITASMAFRRSVLDRVPGFDPEIERGSDSFFSEQLRAAGCRLAFVDLNVEHQFEEKRLLRASFLSAACKMGSASGYIAWHWDHKKVNKPRLQYYLFTAALALYRLANPRPSAEGCSESEIRLVQKVAFFRQYYIEARRPQNYERRGLVKHPAPRAA